jgi:hypothetical protein
MWKSLLSENIKEEQKVKKRVIPDDSICVHGSRDV